MTKERVDTGKEQKGKRGFESFSGKKAKRNYTFENMRKKNISFVILSLPTLVWYLIFCYLPIFGILLAFKRYRLVPGKRFFYSLFASEWVGFENFRFLFLNPQMGRVVRNTLCYNLVFLILGTVIPITLAIILANLYSEKIRSVVQMTALLPHFISWIIVSYFVFAFLSSDRGMINAYLTQAGADGINFYQKPEVWPFILIFVQLWKSAGYTMILYYSYLISINREYYDSALVDGANNLQLIRHIILPMLRPMIVVLVLLNLGHILSTDFGLFYQVTRNSGSILSTTETIDVYVYKALMVQSNFGYSAAASLVQNGIGAVLLLLANFGIRKADPERGIL